MLTREFVQALPKAELHLHLEGAANAFAVAAMPAAARDAALGEIEALAREIGPRKA